MVPCQFRFCCAAMGTPCVLLVKRCLVTSHILDACYHPGDDAVLSPTFPSPASQDPGKPVFWQITQLCFISPPLYSSGSKTAHEVTNPFPLVLLSLMVGRVFASLEPSMNSRTHVSKENFLRSALRFDPYEWVALDGLELRQGTVIKTFSAA